MVELTKDIKGKQGYFGLDNRKLSKLIGVSEKTMGKYINYPGLMSLGTLRLMIKILHIPKEPVIRFLYGEEN